MRRQPIRLEHVRHDQSTVAGGCRGGTERSAARGVAFRKPATRAQPPDEHAPGRVAYAFLHDRVQQAAYDLIPEAQKKPIHLDVGRLLLREFDADAADDRIFTIVNHLNIGGDLIDTAVERLAL